MYVFRVLCGTHRSLKNVLYKIKTLKNRRLFYLYRDLQIMLLSIVSNYPLETHYPLYSPLQCRRWKPRNHTSLILLAGFLVRFCCWESLMWVLPRRRQKSNTATIPTAWTFKDVPFCSSAPDFLANTTFDTAGSYGHLHLFPAVAATLGLSEP